MLVRAKQGTTCPRINPKMPPIDDSGPQQVPDNAYYRRRIIEGSLLRCAGAVGAPAPASSGRAVGDKSKGKEKD